VLPALEKAQVSVLQNSGL